LAEVIKYGLIRDLPFLEWLEANMDGLMARDGELLAEAVERSCANKAEVVAADELETRRRAAARCSTSATPSAMPSRPAWATANGCTARRLPPAR
jgi:hypothetical protein